MDKLTSEIMHLLGFPFQIVPDSAVKERRYWSEVIVPRWDIGLLRPLLLSKASTPYSHISSMREELNRHSELSDWLAEREFMTNLSSAIVATKARIVERVRQFGRFENFGQFTDCNLLLVRSKAPSYYKPGGKAEIGGYGTSRRSLNGVFEAKQKLTRKNYNVKVFEPGKHNLTEQICVFQKCAGIVGIKGAEFANMIWLKPKSRVILIRPTTMNTPPVQEYLADVLNLDYVEILSDQGPFSNLDPELLKQYMD